MSLPTSRGMSSSSGPNMSNMFVSQANQMAASRPGIPSGMIDYRSQLPSHINPFVLNPQAAAGMLGRMPHMGSTAESIASSGSQASSLGGPGHDLNLRSPTMQV